MRCIAAVLLGALLSLGSAGAHAQVYKEIKGCAGSMKVLITCVVIERGVEKVLDVGLSDLVAYILGTKSGVAFRHHTKVVYGTPGNPMSPEDVQAKALELISPVLGSKLSNALADAVWNLEKIKDINALAAIVKGE